MTPARLILSALAIILVAVAILHLGGCRRSCPACPATPAAPAAKPVPMITVVTERVACYSRARPRPEPFRSKGRKEGCPEPFTSCLERPDAVALRDYLADLEAWSEDVEARCADLKPAPPRDDPLPAAPTPTPTPTPTPAPETP